jgi:hypothetical protein
VLIYSISIENKNINPIYLGVVCLCKFYQEFYGTLIYFLSYIFNKRYKSVSLIENLGFVGISNGLWFVFPCIGMYSSFRLIIDNNFSVFGR